MFSRTHYHLTLNSILINCNCNYVFFVYIAMFKHIQTWTDLSVIVLTSLTPTEQSNVSKLWVGVVLELLFG